MFQSKLSQLNSAPPSPQGVTIGVVVDTNDPQNMGRVRVLCTQWGDLPSTPVEDIPWAMYLSPLGGHTSTGTRGPGIQGSTGAIAYGFWGIPKTGASVAVMCIDGNPQMRMWIGCVYDQFTPHTMPSGRYTYEEHPALEPSFNAFPYGPYTSAEYLIQPLAQNLADHFGNKSEPNYEWRSRGADYTVSRVGVDSLDFTYSRVADDVGVTHDGWTSTQGYQTNRQNPQNASTTTDKSYDSMVYSFVSPGFHSFSFDDRQENCRVKIRTTSGHQILLDDTNERIYISTAQGNNWIELDQNGNIDVYTSNKLNIRAARDVNITSDETVRIYGKQGVHIKSDTETIVESGDKISFTSTNINVNGSSNLNLTGTAAVNITSSGTIAADGSAIHLNSGESTPAPRDQAKWTNRVPAHEPWARTMTINDLTHQPEHDYTSPEVNRSERGRTYARGMYWRR